MTAHRSCIDRLVRFSLTSADAVRAARFYETAFGCSRLAMDRWSGPEFERLMGVRGGASRITLGLGQEIIELLQFDVPGRPYPAAARCCDRVFQHFAIVVADMGLAIGRLSGVAGWVPISDGGPQQLPASSGAVTAFKFRDPDGHPLEFLFVPGDAERRCAASQGAICLGIDHSAISVADTATSIAFCESFGLRVCARSFNRGCEQERLDALPGVQLDVTALAPRQRRPHLELLCYQQPISLWPEPARGNNDIAATRLVFQTGDEPQEAGHVDLPCIVSDPDGHRWMMIAPDS